MTSSRLDRTVTIQLDGAGAGVASLGPVGMREKWSPMSAHVIASPATNESSCYLFVGDRPLNATYRDATSTGSSGDTTDAIAGEIRVPDRVWAVWSGGTPNALATLSIVGTSEV